MPKGTVRYASPDVEPGLLPQGPEDLLDECNRGAAERLAHEALMRIAAGEPCTPKVANLMSELCGEIYGVPPGMHWAHLIIEELERAKRQFVGSAEVGSDVHFSQNTRIR